MPRKLQSSTVSSLSSTDSSELLVSNTSLPISSPLSLERHQRPLTLSLLKVIISFQLSKTILFWNFLILNIYILISKVTSITASLVHNSSSWPNYPSISCTWMITQAISGLQLPSFSMLATLLYKVLKSDNKVRAVSSHLSIPSSTLTSYWTYSKVLVELFWLVSLQPFY